MWKFPDLLKSIGNLGRKKRYVGLLEGSLPVNTKNWNSSDFLRALDISLYTNRAIEKRADKVGEIEFILTDKSGNEIENDPMLALLYKPNKLFTGRQFWKLYQKYVDTVGECYILLEGEREIFETRAKITALHLLNPLCVTPKFGKDGMPVAYEYKTDTSSIEYKPNQILYINNPDPKNPLRGQSLLRTGIAAIQTETQISTYHSRILENGGKVEGVFSFKTGQLTEEQLKEVKDRYKKEYGEAKKAGLPLFLGGDSSYIKTGLNPEEMAFMEAKRMTLEDICILTGVPKSLLASTNDVKFDNADADRAIFLRETIYPLLVTLTSALDEVLFPDDRILTFVDPTPENIDRKLKETETGIKNYYMTINEARERHDLDPIEGGDEILVPFSVMPLGSEPADAGLTDTEKAAIRTRLLRTMKENKIVEHPLKDKDVREIYHRMQVKRMDQREKPFKSKLRGYFSDQENRIIERLQPGKTRQFRKKTLLDELMQIEIEVKLGKELFLPLMTDLLKDAGVDAMELAGSGYEFTLTDDIRSWLESRADIFLHRINATTFEELKAQFEESLATGEGREQLIGRIQETYKTIRKSRAALIARTEVHNATQYGTIQGYKQSGLTIKIWVAVGDAATRDSHLAIDGEERPLDRPFSNGLMFPGDPNGPAEEVINCRCVV